jgi:hypothetical protein
LDVAGAYTKWALDILGAQYGLGLAIGLELGLDGVLSRWTIGFGPEFGLVNGQQPNLTLTLTVLTGLVQL